MILNSEVPDFIGECKPTWLNRNSVCRLLDGGATGFFRLVKPVMGGLFKIRTGKEFHGMVCSNGVIRECGGERIHLA